MVIECFVFLLTTAQELVKMWHAMVVWYKGEKVYEISVSIKNSATWQYFHPPSPQLTILLTCLLGRTRSKKSSNGGRPFQKQLAEIALRTPMNTLHCMFTNENVNENLHKKGLVFHSSTITETAKTNSPWNGIENWKNWCVNVAICCGNDMLQVSCDYMGFVRNLVLP